MGLWPSTLLPLSRMWISKIIVFGRSLGGAVAIYLAASLSHVDK